MKGEGPAGRILWQGKIVAVQCRAWVWRYVTDNRTHHHLGFNLWVDGTAGDQEGEFSVAISESQQSKLQFRAGDVAKGSGWPCKGAKHEVTDYYRAGGLRLLSRVDVPTTLGGPPFVQVPPALATFKARGARMLDPKRWRKECMTCVWANKSAVEIEYTFGKSKRYRAETFCYGPKSCRLYAMGPPRPVPYHDRDLGAIDDGGLDDCCTSHRGPDE